MKTTQNLTNTLKDKAAQLGFDACGIARATALVEQRHVVTDWLAKGYHAEMGYMANHFEKRLDPRKLVPEARSVVVVAQNYFPHKTMPSKSHYKVSRYAYGKDYHSVIKEKLYRLAEFLTQTCGSHHFRVFCDSAPVLERSWAQLAGLGNHGKNTCLILPRKGSFFFLGELITSIELDPDIPFEKDLCGICTRCMDACPTKAIVAPGVLDSGKCISYLTIENKEMIPLAYRNKCEGWIFGCDICQEVCPHNKKARNHSEDALKPLHPINNWNKEEWEKMSKEEFNHHFKKADSPIARITYEKLMDNIRASTSGSR